MEEHRFIPGSSGPRPLLTYLRYPVQNDGQRLSGPLPLIVFAHGFTLSPGPYAPLLNAWAQDGYAVAAPVFPREASSAPGGPDESDLPNQPGDLSFLITWLLDASRSPTGQFHGLIDPSRIAVSGHSDGGDSALELVYGSGSREPRVKAVIVLSGAEMPGHGQPYFTRGGPPLLATQGTADSLNPPSDTDIFFKAAPTPKFLLELPGAEHVGPYTEEQPQLQIVERITLAFLGRYLNGERSAQRGLSVPPGLAGVATLIASP